MGDVFGADTALTRAQMVTFFRNYAKFTGKSVDEVVDITKYVDYKDVEDWAKPNMAWAVSIDLISGADINGTKYLQPLGNATRAQLATVLVKYCNYY